MTIRTIKINKEAKPSLPTIRLTGVPLGSVWQHIGFSIPNTDTSLQEHHDLNRAAQMAASALAKKVAGRQINVELTIDPLIPPLSFADSLLVPIATAIAENASASVEPGPGTVILRTWWKDKHVGIDAVGCGGYMPQVIRENLTRPGFSTRVDDWDTGFGLHAAIEAAGAIAAKVELLEPNDSIGFRLAIPLRSGSPLSPCEKQVGPNEYVAPIESNIFQNEDLPESVPFNFPEVIKDVASFESIEA